MHNNTNDCQWKKEWPERNEQPDMYIKQDTSQMVLASNVQTR
jgi:hypothetical protein